MPKTQYFAPGWPGSAPTWTSSAKTGLGTAISPASRIWFTISHGILNEIYYPRVDLACTRDLQFLVTDGQWFFSEEKRDTRHAQETAADGVPAYRIKNRCLHDRYQIEKAIVCDPHRHVVLQHVKFTPADEGPSHYQLYALLAPHLGNQGSGNSAWVDEYKGVPMLFASRGELSLALACSADFVCRSVGYVGVSDGWQLLNHYKQLPYCYHRADNGNVALTGQLPIHAAASPEGVVLALALGERPAEAAQRARASLQAGFEAAWEEYIDQWQQWHERVSAGHGDHQSRRRISTAVLKIHESKRFPGGIIASLSIPWGTSKGDNDIGGYHLVWPRDLIETAGGLVAAGAHDDAVRVLDFLRATQEADGHWSQNMWLDGQPYWHGVQMDETALPILLLDMVRRELAWPAEKTLAYWPMARLAVQFIVQNGPVTQQDRWEEDPGYSPFTLAAEIAGLLAAADLAELAGEETTAAYLRDTADSWYANLDSWIYAVDTPLAREVGVEGYYVRVASPEVSEAASPLSGFVAIKNRPPNETNLRAIDIVSPDALALVRFGLRRADDPRMVNTAKVIDAILKKPLPQGPGWRRYNHDGYGEKADGSPFDGTGIGRIWPLLAGERAHYELAAGNIDTAWQLLRTLEESAGHGGLLPEQSWDAADIPERELYFGRPAGSAMPLVWAHAEHLKLLRSLSDGRIFDLPPQTVARYLKQQPPPAPYEVWRFNHKLRQAQPGRPLRIEALAPTRVRWSMDQWQTVNDTPSFDTGLGMHIVDLPDARTVLGDACLADGRSRAVEFTFYWPETDRWEGVNFRVEFECSKG